MGRLDWFFIGDVDDYLRWNQIYEFWRQSSGFGGCERDNRWFFDWPGDDYFGLLSFKDNRGQCGGGKSVKMKNKGLKATLPFLILFGVGLGLFSLFMPVKAQQNNSTSQSQSLPINVPKWGSWEEATWLTSLLTTIINTILGLAGGLGVLAIVYAGLMYLTAGGNGQQAEKAKKTLIWAVAGLILLGLILVLPNWIKKMMKGEQP